MSGAPKRIRVFWNLFGDVAAVEREVAIPAMLPAGWKMGTYRLVERPAPGKRPPNPLFVKYDGKSYRFVGGILTTGQIKKIRDWCNRSLAYRGAV